MQLLGTAHTEVGFNWLGVPDDHHAIEHGGGANAIKMDKVQTFFAGEIAKFLNRLKSTPEGNGNMLDNSLVFFFTDFSDAADHSHDKIPTFTFGRAGGKVTPGRTVPYVEEKGHGHLLWGILNAFDIAESVGDPLGGSAISLA